MVERGEPARKIVWLAVARARGRDEADVACHRRHRRQESQRLEICHIVWPPAFGTKIAFADGARIGKEDQVELPPLGGLGHFQVMRRITPGINLRAWMQPCGNMVARRVEMNRETHLLPGIALARGVLVIAGHCSAPTFPHSPPGGVWL